MKILSYVKKQKHIFLHVYESYFLYYSFDLRKNKIKYDCIDATNSKKLATKLQQQIDKLLDSNYSEVIITTDTFSLSKQIASDIIIDKTYCFLLLNDKNTLESKFSSLKLVNYKANEEYRLGYFNDEIGFQTLEMHFAGLIHYEYDYVDDHFVTSSFEEYIQMLLTMSFKYYETHELRSLITKTTVDDTQATTANFIKVKDPSLLGSALSNKHPHDEFYIQYNYINEAITVRSDCVFIKNNKVIAIDKYYNFSDNLDDIKTIKTQIDASILKSDNYGEELSTAAFYKKYQLELKPDEHYKAPVLKEITLPELPLVIPAKPIALKALENSILELNSLYFYADTTANDPLEWLVSFIVVKDFKEGTYIGSKVIALKNFNKEYKKNETEELKYSDDIRAFFKKLAKKYTKAGLQPVETALIFEKLTGCTFNQLKKQTILDSFQQQIDYEKELIEVYDNYASIRIAIGDKKQYLQFFKTEEERKQWLTAYTKKKIALYPAEIKLVESFARKLQSQQYISSKKEALLEKYSTKVSLSNADLLELNKASFEIKDNWIHDTHFELNQETSIYIKGDFSVDGTLFLNRAGLWSKAFFIVEGTLKVKNLIIDGGFNYFFASNVIVENYTVINTYRASHFISQSSSTDILLHDKASVTSFKPTLNFNKEASIVSNGIADLSIRIKDDDTFSFNFIKVNELLCNNSPLLVNDFEKQTVDIDAFFAADFESYMKDWGCYYHDLAGCSTVSVYEDKELKKGSMILPEAGDWVVLDDRGKSGTYGYSHEDASITEVTLKKPEKYDVDYSLTPLKLKVSAENLMERYQWMSSLFINWAHRETASPYGNWENVEELNTSYEDEKTTFDTDPHLALYWLLHFGFTIDNRYAEVKELVLKLELAKELPIFNMAIGYFNKTNAYHSLDLSSSSNDDEETEILKTAFLKRRAYLIWITQSYTYRGGAAALLQCYTAVAIYPNPEENTVKRVRWLGNNLLKYKSWDAFDKIIKEIDTSNISLLSYVMALNPNTKDSAAMANNFLIELDNEREIWGSGDACPFAQIMIWELRDLITDKELLRSLVDFYFRANKIDKKYEDLKIVLGDKIESLEEVREQLSIFNTKITDYKNSNGAEDKKQGINKVIEKALSEIKPVLLLKVINAMNEYALQIRTFHYLMTNTIEDKAFVTSELLLEINIDKYAFKDLFTEGLATFIKDEEDPNMALVKDWLSKPIINHSFCHKDYTKQDFPLEKAIEFEKEYTPVRTVASLFLRYHIQTPSVFNFVITAIKKALSNGQIALATSIFTGIFAEDIDDDFKATAILSRQQLEELFQYGMSSIAKHIFQRELCKSIIDIITECNNPLALDWVQEQLKDDVFWNTFKAEKLDKNNIDLEDLKKEIRKILLQAKEEIEENI